MNWDDLRHVLAIHRAGTLALAGARLQVAHTTVGRRLRGLEAQVGVRLFDRTPQGFAATEAGHDLIEVALQVERDVLAAEGRVKGQDQRLEGPLHVSTMDMFFCGFPDLFRTFVQAFPQIDLTISTSLDRVSLTRREADVVLRLTNDPPEHLVGRRLGRVQFAVYAADSLLAQHPAAPSLSDLPWLGFADGPEARWLHGWQQAHAPGARTVLRVDDNARVRQHAVAHGLGVFFLPCFEGDALPGVRRVSPIQHDFAHDIWLLTLRDLRRTSRVRAFMDHATSAFQQQQQRLAGRDAPDAHYRD